MWSLIVSDPLPMVLLTLVLLLGGIMFVTEGRAPKRETKLPELPEPRQRWKP